MQGSANGRVKSSRVLLGEGSAAKILVTHADALRAAQSKIAQDGPGKDLLYRAINGFDKGSAGR